MLRQYLAAGAQGDAAPSCESSIARHQGRGFRPAGTHRSLHAASQVALSGRTAWGVERPRAKLPARGPSLWQTIVSVSGVVVSVSGVILSIEATLRGRRDFERAQRDSERAQRESKEGRIEFAVDRVMQPFPPQKKEAEVVERGIMKAIRRRILHWNQHATIIAGRFGSGKSVALEEALRGRQGVYVHKVRGNDWEEKLYEDLNLDNELMLETVLRKIGDGLGKPPVLVLDIPRSTKEGGGALGHSESFSLLLFLDSEAWALSPASPRLSRRTVRWHTPGPEASAALFRCAAL